MNLIRHWLFALSTCLIFTSVATAQDAPAIVSTNDIEPGKEYYTGIKAEGPITLDGNLDDWGASVLLVDPRFSVPKFSGSDPNVEGELVNFELHNGGTWSGPDDQTSAVRVVYDDENVYFGFVVTDDYHENAANSAWNGDSVQLMVANGARDEIIGLYNYALGGVEDDLGEVIVMHERGAAADNPDFETEAVITRDGDNKQTIYEIRLPKGALGLEETDLGSGGVQFGLGMAINDGDDGPGQNGQKGWGGLGAHSIVFGKHPSETARVTLAISNDMEPGKEFHTARQAPEGPIELDGSLDDWDGVPVLADPRFAVPKFTTSRAPGANLTLFEIHNGGIYDGPDDQTSAVQIAYDQDNVYFAFVVTDDYHENSANSAWNGDSVQLMVADKTQNEIVGLYNYALGGVEDDIGEVIVMHERGAAADNPDFETSAVISRDKDNKRTIYEIQLPKGSLGLDNLVSGAQFGLGMAINDGDEAAGQGGQKGWGGLGAHSIVFGKHATETALVTLDGYAPAVSECFISAPAPPSQENPDVHSFRLNSFGSCEVDPDSVSLRVDGEPLEVTVTPAALGAFDVTYVWDTPFPGGTRHVSIIEASDTAGNAIETDPLNWIAPAFATLTPDMRVNRVDRSQPGFVLRVFQNELYQPGSISEAEVALAGEAVDVDGEPIDENLADESMFGPAEGPGEIVGDLVEFEVGGVVNMNASVPGDVGNFPVDEQMPGVPGVNGAADGAVIEVVAFVEFPAGRHTMGVNSDDGFRMEGGPLDNPETLGLFGFPRGAFPSRFKFDVVEAGVYPIRVLYYNRGGGANLEIFHVFEEGEVLLNDLENGGFPAFRRAPEEFLITAFDRNANGVDLTWQSKEGRYYAVDTSTDLLTWETIVSEFPEGGATAASTDYSDATVPADADDLYYRVRQVPPPALLSTDFEDGAEGWTAVTDLGDTEWQLGTPNVEGLTTAASGTMAWGTNLDSDYAPGTFAARLRSPVIDVSGDSSPRLSFNFYIDSVLDTEGGQLRFLDENGDELAVVEEIFSGQSEGWKPYSIRFPGAARGGNVIIEFAFLSDEDDEVGAGWYIDDVRID